MESVKRAPLGDLPPPKGPYLYKEFEEKKSIKSEENSFSSSSRLDREMDSISSPTSEESSSLNAVHDRRETGKDSLPSSLLKPQSFGAEIPTRHVDDEILSLRKSRLDSRPSSRLHENRVRTTDISSSSSNPDANPARFSENSVRVAESSLSSPSDLLKELKRSLSVDIQLLEERFASELEDLKLSYEKRIEVM